MDNQQWLNWRNKGIGGSDCAAILGLSPYMNNIELWEDKSKNIRKPFKGPKNDILERGHKVEPLIRELFKIDHPEFVVFYQDNDHFIHPEYDFIRGTVDGRLTEKSTGKKGILEIKHVQIENKQQSLKWTFDSFPQNYYCQILHYLECSGLEFAILKARIRNNYNGNLYISEREYRIEKTEHQASIDHLITAEIEFWNKYVITGIRPPLVLPEF